jgi:hypothetical protein
MDIQGDLKDQINMHYFAVVNIVICGCEFESRPGDTSLWDKVCQRFAAGRWFYLGTLVIKPLFTIVYTTFLCKTTYEKRL